MKKLIFFLAIAALASCQSSKPKGKYIGMPEEPVQVGDQLEVIKITNDTIDLGYLIDYDDSLK